MSKQRYHFEPQIAKIFDHLYANSDFKTPTAIAAEVYKILHAGIYQEKTRATFSPAFKFLAGEASLLLSGERNSLDQFSAYLDKIFRKMSDSTSLYTSSESIRLSPFDRAFVCCQLDGIPLSDGSRDIFGDTVESFRSYWSKTHGGQFFTDSHVTRLAITLLQFDPEAGDDLVDISAGTGGFLLAGLQRVLEDRSPH